MSDVPALPTVPPPAAEAGHTVRILRDVDVPLPDGDGALAANVFLPDGAEAHPALVTLLPYHKDGPAGIAAWPWLHWLAERGYACVLADVRGLAASSGRARGPFDPGEADDGAALVQWTAQQPWCSGRVGMWGQSYGAITAMRTAVRRPPALRAICAIVGPADPMTDFVHPDGVHGCLPSLGAWGLTTLAQRLWPPLHQDPQGRWLARWRRRLEDAVPFVVDLARAAPGDTSWAIDAGAIDVPTLCVAGWRDLFCEGSLRAYEAIRAPKRLVVGPWMHAVPDESPIEPIDFLSMALGWWDRWLRDDGPAHDDPEPPVSVWLQGREAWHGLHAWPPRDTRALELHPHPDGALATGAAGSGERTRAVDPTVGIGSGLWCMPTRGTGAAADQHEDDARSLAFTTAPLDASLAIAGRPSVTLALRRTGAGPRTVVVKLAEVDADGRSLFITTGTRRLAGEDAVVDIVLRATCFELGAGRHLRLVVAGADFPRLWPDGGDVPDLTVSCPGTVLRLPVREGWEDDAAVVPRRERPLTSPLVLSSTPVYRTTRDRVADALTVEYGDDTLVRTVDGLSTLRTSRRLTASVTAARPDAAAVDGTLASTVDGPQGRIAVDASLTLRRGLVVARGEVTWDGRQVFARRWTA
jgi:putative CocE/NonD family hydrolase